MKKIILITLSVISGLFLTVNTVIATPKADTVQLAPGYGALGFHAPKAGSYHLDALGKAANGSVLTSENKPKKLFDFMGDKVVLLSFIYATCSDVNGCPLATMVFHQIKKRLLKNAKIASRLRLLTLSFNPTMDTPEKMRAYGKNFQKQGLEWQFLTTQSEQELAPILQHYQQNIQKIYNEQGQFTGTFSHLLRVYLIDKNKIIRNIYSVDFLHPDTLISDIKTLLQENQQATQNSVPKQELNTSIDLLNNSLQPPLGLPTVIFPKNNPPTAKKIALGRKLFFDRRLSLNDTFSCAMCHVPEQGFGSYEMATSVGVEGRTVRRNAPTLYNVAYMKKLFHDGREDSLAQQAWSPLLAHNEMANPSIGYVINKIKQQDDYKGLFQAAFKRGVTMETVGMALASYQRSLNSADSAFDRWFYGQQNKALTAKEQQGYHLFIGKAGCAQCHLINKKSALFTDHQLHNTGIGYQQSMLKPPKKQRIQITENQFIEVDSNVIDRVSAATRTDLGRYEITQNPADRWKYKTPTLRNITLTAPYMHNGQFQTLAEVINFYNQGGVKNENLDPLIKPLHLSTQEQAALLAFLNSLTGRNVNALVNNALAAPIGERK